MADPWQDKRETVLCFEDLAPHRKVIQEQLQGVARVEFWKAAGATAWDLDGDEELQAIAKIGPIAVVIDMVDDATGNKTAGMRIARKLRQSPHTRELRLVALSAYFDPVGNDRALRERAEKTGQFELVLPKDPNGYAELRGFIQGSAKS